MNRRTTKINRRTIALLGLLCASGCASNDRFLERSIRWPFLNEANQQQTADSGVSQTIPSGEPAPWESFELAESPNLSSQPTSGPSTASQPVTAEERSLLSPVNATAPSPKSPPSPVVKAASETAVETSQTMPFENSTTFRTGMDGNVLECSNAIPLNLPSVLAAVDGQHPVVAQAQWRVREAYARLDQAKVLWLPTIQAGFSFHRHDGNYQASNGSIVDVNRNSFQYGLGAGATGAGTTAARPGLLAQFHLADAIFEPKVTRKTAYAQGHASCATLNRQLLRAGEAYYRLLSAHQELQITIDSMHRMEELAKITSDFAEAGEGLQADADRLQAELAVVQSRKLWAEERAAIASAQLIEAMSWNGADQVIPMDLSALPVELISSETDADALVTTALRSRPELKASQALVSAACEAYRREKFAPFVPSVLLGFSTSGFGGGVGSNLDNIDGRYDVDALLSWQVRQMGFGEKAARREKSAQVQQARFEKLEMLDQVAREVREAHSKIRYRRRQIDVAQAAIQSARDSHRRNLERIRDGQGLPLEVLQSVQALETAQSNYLNAIIDFNLAQLQLQWSIGFPAS